MSVLLSRTESSRGKTVSACRKPERSVKSSENAPSVKGRGTDTNSTAPQWLKDQMKAARLRQIAHPVTTEEMRAQFRACYEQARKSPILYRKLKSQRCHCDICEDLRAL
jgi:hypothetical protein